MSGGAATVAPMQLAQPGRNEPCPCGSGRKYKKCCLGAEPGAAVPGDLDVAALVDRAIETDDWDAVHEIFDRGFALFEPLAPLEHVRFRSDLIGAREPAPAAYARLCEGGWLRFCEREITYVLDHDELDLGARDGLRLAVYMLRRFGAKSPVVESVAALQAQEYTVRIRRFADALSVRGLTPAEVDASDDDFEPWLQRARPAILPFADWFALRATSRDDDANALWLSAIAPRVCDVALARLDRPDLPDANHWLRIAALTLAGDTWLGPALAALTPAAIQTADEQMVYTALTTQTPHPELAGAIERIMEATAARQDYAGAALLREVQQRVRARSVLRQPAERG